MRIIILGSNGLLGNTIIRYFFENFNYETFGFCRDSSKLGFLNKNNFQRINVVKDIFNTEDLKKKIEKIKPDVIINSIGITNKIKNENSNFIQKIIQVNSLFPHQLQKLCLQLGIRLIHLSSDCVFSGDKGFYSEQDNPDPIDIYGKSKLLGELDYENTITIRKSVIGHEINSKNGLLEWFLKQEGEVKGYKKAIFSGITVLELAKVIDMHIIPNQNLRGVYHVSGQSISKYNLLKIIASEYKKVIKIVPNEEVKIDRSLNSTKFNKITGYQSEAWPKLIKSMAKFNLLR
ncbi:SDR family oxidoreductase [Prochlorococcus sp. AH-716-P08]|nr:SDR family oxidoreductase [Prochlorococcus sp. AH-716-P08]